MSDFQYDSFTISDSEFPPKWGGEFGIKHDLRYKERVAAWQEIEDAKSLEEQLEDARKAAYEAVDDCISGCRNAPHSTLEREIRRGYALHGLLYCRHTSKAPLEDKIKMGAHYQRILDSIPPVSPPSKTYYDYLDDGVERMTDKIDEIVRAKVAEQVRKMVHD